MPDGLYLVRSGFRSLPRAGHFLDSCTAPRAARIEKERPKESAGRRSRPGATCRVHGLRWVFGL